MSGSWSNTGSVQAYVVVITTGVVGSGLFVYDGPPATGNLIASIAAAAGTDPYTNDYLAGFTSYGTGGGFAQLLAGALNIGSGTGGEPDTADQASITLDILDPGVPCLQLLGPIGTTFTDQLLLRLIPGTPGAGTADGGATILQVLDKDQTSAAAVQLSGAVVRTDLEGNPYTLQTPVYATDWAAKDNNGAFPGLQLRLDGQDNLTLKGVFHMTLAAGLAAGTYTINSTALVAPWLPAESWRLPGGDHTSSSNVWKAQVLVEVTTGGLIQITTSSAIAQGDNFYVSWDCPLGDLQ